MQHATYIKFYLIKYVFDNDIMSYEYLIVCLELFTLRIKILSTFKTCIPEELGSFEILISHLKAYQDC